RHPACQDAAACDCRLARGLRPLDRGATPAGANRRFGVSGPSGVRSDVLCELPYHRRNSRRRQLRPRPNARHEPRYDRIGSGAQHILAPPVVHPMFQAQCTAVILFVALPALFRFANFPVPLIIRSRDMAFPRLNAFSFWLTAFSGILLYFSFLGGSGLYGAGDAPDVRWFAYAALTARTSSPGHRSDYWPLAHLASGFGSVGPARDRLT